MINIANQSVLALCRRIHMPDEAVKIILQIIGSKDWHPYHEAFRPLTGKETAAEAGNLISQSAAGRYNGLFELSCHLAAAVITEEIYSEKGIQEDIYLHTMGMFTRFVHEHKESFGVYGFDRGFWTPRILSLQLFRIGELEYEIPYQKEAAEASSSPQNTTSQWLHVHIPSDAKLTGEALSDSYMASAAFLKNYFPDFQPEFWYTDTWLLSPELKPLLNASSKILRFASDYRIIETNPEDKSYMQWVFKKEYKEQEDYAALPEDTSLQKNIKRLLLSGGRVGSAKGIKPIKNY